MEARRLTERAPGIIARRIAGETILVPSQRRAKEMALFTLNDVGTYVWEQIDGETDGETLVSRVVAAFDVAPERARADVTAFLADLETAGCVREVTP